MQWGSVHGQEVETKLVSHLTIHPISHLTSHPHFIPDLSPHFTPDLTWSHTDLLT